MNALPRRALLKAAAAAPLIVTVASGTAQANASVRQCIDTSAEARPEPVLPGADQYVRTVGLVHTYRHGTESLVTYDFGTGLEYLASGAVFQREPHWQEQKGSPVQAHILYLFEADGAHTGAIRLGPWPVYRVAQSEHYTPLTGSCWCSISPNADECNRL